MFLNYRPNLRHPSEHSPEFSLPYSLAFLGQISQLSNGTMGMLRLPLPFSSPSVSLGFDTTYGTLSFLSSAMVSVLTIADLEIWVRYSHIYLCSCGDRRLSRVSMCAFRISDTDQDPGRINATCLLRSIDVAPTGLKVNAPTINNLSRLNCTFNTRCIRFMQASLPTMQCSLTVGDQPFRAGLITC